MYTEDAGKALHTSCVAKYSMNVCVMNNYFSNSR